MLTLQVEEKLSKTISGSGRHPAVPIFARGSVEARIILAFYPANENNNYSEHMKNLAYLYPVICSQSFKWNKTEKLAGNNTDEPLTLKRKELFPAGSCFLVLFP